MRTRIRPVLFSLAFAVLSAGAAEAQPFAPAAVQSAQARISSTVPGLVKIWVHCSAGNWSGAGVVYNSTGHILSAAHLAKDCAGLPTDVLVGAPASLYDEPRSTHRAEFVGRIGDGNPAPTPAQAGDLHTQDLALYRIVPGQPPIAPARLASEPFVAGDAVHIAGFSDLPFRIAEEMGARPTRNAGVSIYRTSIISVATDGGATPLRLHYEGGGWPGMSGGPVYNSRNEVIGIHSGRATHRVHGVLTGSCPPNGCDDNAVTFAYTDAGTVKRQVVNANISSMKSILDNFGWATSIFAVPSTWPKP